MQRSWRGSAGFGMAATIGGVFSAWLLWVISPERFVIVFLLTQLKKWHHDGTARAPRRRGGRPSTPPNPPPAPRGGARSVLAAPNSAATPHACAQKKKRHPQLYILAHFSPPAQEEQEPKTTPTPAAASPSLIVSPCLVVSPWFRGCGHGGARGWGTWGGCSAKRRQGWPRRPRKSATDARTSSPSGHLSIAECVWLGVPSLLSPILVEWEAVPAHVRAACTTRASHAPCVPPEPELD